jgi:glycosyltransferase involved in cell wall biosynthesis
VPLVTVLTPTQARNADHIGALWASIAASDPPSGWEVEWVVQEDGDAPAVRGRLPDDPRIRYDALGVQLGGPATRNHGLARARGDLVAGIDHDDTYLDGGLAALLAPLMAAPAVAWTCGRVRWDMVDGSTWRKEDVLPPGRVAPRAVTDHFLATDDFPFPAAMAAFRRDVLVAHGGWPAVARSTDAVLLAALSDRWPGWWVASDVAVYRRWPSQKTVQPLDWAIRDLPHVRGVIAQRRAAEDALADRRPG